MKLVPFKRKDHAAAPWYVRFEVRKRPYLWSTKTTDYKLAEQRGEDYREKVIARAYTLIAPMKSGTTGSSTFEDMFKAYMEMPTPPHETRKKNVQAFRMLLRTVKLSPNDPLHRLDVQTALRFQQLFLAHRPGAVVTCNGIMRKARSLFSRRAMICYDIDVPEAAVRSFFKVPLLREPEPRRELPAAEADAKAMAELPARPELYRAYLLARFGGLRAGEILAARRDWLEGDVLYVGGKEFVAKGKKWRAIRLAPEVVKILTEHDHVTSLVGPNAANVVKKLMAPTLKAMGFPDKPLHSCRRLFGSIVFTNQSPAMAQAVLGHSSITTTERHYSRLLKAPAAVPFAG